MRSLATRNCNKGSLSVNWCICPLGQRRHQHRRLMVPVDQVHQSINLPQHQPDLRSLLPRPRIQVLAHSSTINRTGPSSGWCAPIRNNLNSNHDPPSYNPSDGLIAKTLTAATCNTTLLAPPDHPPFGRMALKGSRGSRSFSSAQK